MSPEKTMRRIARRQRAARLYQLNRDHGIFWVAGKYLPLNAHYENPGVGR